MALRLEQKQAIVAEVSRVAESALSVVLADYRGIGVGAMTAMRAKARKSGVYLKVVRNTLARRAVQGTNFECLSEALVGPTLLAFSQDDPGAAARLLQDFTKEHTALQVKAVSIGGILLGADALERVAKLPTRDEALAMLMAVIQAPISKLARTLIEVPAKLVRAVAAIGDQKQQSA